MAPNHPSPITVTTTEFDDHDEPDEQGMYEYRYQGWIYTIHVDGTCFVARMYKGDERPPHFLRTEQLGSWTGFDMVPYEDKRFATAVSALLTETGRAAADIFVGGRYEQIDLSRLAH